MSSKAIIKPYQVVTNGNMGGNLTSLITDVESSDNIAYQVSFTGTPTGSFSVQGTIDGTNWVNLDLGTPGPSAAGTPDSHLISLVNLPYSKTRLVYTRTSGSGVLTVWVMAKRQGG